MFETFKWQIVFFKFEIVNKMILFLFIYFYLFLSFFSHSLVIVLSSQLKLHLQKVHLISGFIFVKQIIVFVFFCLRLYILLSLLYFRFIILTLYFRFFILHFISFSVLFTLLSGTLFLGDLNKHNEQNELFKEECYAHTNFVLIKAWSFIFFRNFILFLFYF